MNNLIILTTKVNLNIYKNILYKGNQNIGNSVFGLINKNNAIIHNIAILPEYRKKGLGKYLLNHTEKKILFMNSNIKSINILAHQKSDVGISLINFFKDNNYNVINYNVNSYDDGNDIYDLYPMVRYI